MSRRMDELKIEVGRVVNRARTMTRTEGVGPTVKFFARLVVEHIDYLAMRKRRADARFTFDGIELPYAYYLYSQTWRNERSLEIAVAEHFLAQRPPGRMLEVGNVLGHFGIVGHDVLDRYEQVEGVLNEDILTFEPDWRYDTVVSVSTLEHVRFDEELEKDPHGSSRALDRLRLALGPGGRMLVTVPLGYNYGLDADIRSGRFSSAQQTYYKRVSAAGDWAEVTADEALACLYGFPYEAANAVMVGVTQATA